MKHESQSLGVVLGVAGSVADVLSPHYFGAKIPVIGQKLLDPIFGRISRGKV